jgi:CubicO group peptidase (beta-lactamase class C family)
VITASAGKPLPDADSTREALAYFESYLGFQQISRRLPGIQAAVHAHGSIALSTAHGRADVEDGVALGEDHLFRVASHSKTFTATAIVQLVERGALRLDDSVSSWIDFLGDSPLGAITVRELLAHQGGVVRDGADGDFWQLRGRFLDRDALRNVLRGEDTAALARNTRFKYSNVGYALAGLVAEAASGVAYNELVRAQIVDRLGLRNTGPELALERAEEYVVGYTAFVYGAERVPIENVDSRAMSPATGFFSTARDLVTFFSAHFLGDERLLSDDSKREMQSALWDTHDGTSRYGLGLQTMVVGDRELVSHSGGWPGQSTHTLADPHARLAISVLTNAIDGNAKALAHAGVSLVDLAGERPRPSETADLDRFAGRFVNIYGVTDLAVLGGRLFQLSPVAADPAEEAVPLEVVDDQTLRVVGGSGFGSYGEPISFVFGDDGRPRSLRGQSGMSLVAYDEFAMPERIVLTDA